MIDQLTERGLQRASEHTRSMSKRLPMAAAAVALFFFFVVVVSVLDPAAKALVEHTFVVSQVNVRRLGKETPVILVNEQFPGPVIDVTEGDSVAVHVVNRSPRGVTIHWHGIKQQLTCWADGPTMVTQCPIPPNNTFTYRFRVKDQEGTLWWHAHIACLRATVHGVFIIRPKLGPTSYPFPVPDKEVPIVIGEWWKTDLYQLEKNLIANIDGDYPLAAAINGKLGDLYNASGVAEDNYTLSVEYGKTYLLRMVNAALYSEYIFKIAGHKFTVVSADASYTKPFETDVIMIAPGETVDILMVADATPGRYYMVALAMQPPKPDTQIPMFVTRGLLEYNSITNMLSSRQSANNDIIMPEVPDQHDIILSFYFRGNLTSLPHHLLPQVPRHVDEHMFVTLGLGTICQGHKSSCKRGKGSDDDTIVATMNNVTFQPPTTTPLLEAHFYNKLDRLNVQQLPSRPPRMFNFTDLALVPFGPLEERLEPTTPKAVIIRRFQYNATVEVVFQSTSVLQSDSNPMHLHGHNFFVLAQGLGNYDVVRDVKRYNLVDPPLRNTVLVPALGWVAIRFIADNPGAWYMHCHYEFHVVMGMAAVFIVENGPTLDTSLPPPPSDLPNCEDHNTLWGAPHSDLFR